jgi:quinol-cytochrome oxidoreductase complex cytochrome b subunit
LIIFYTIHTTVMPVLVIILMGFHFWRIRKARGVVIPRSPGTATSDNPERILALPNLFLREFSAGLALFAFVLLVSLIFNAPLGEEANPGMSPNPAKAPWYFMGLQELLVHFHPVFAVLIIPLLAAAGMLLLPYLNYDEDTSGIFMASHRGRRWAAAAALTAATVTPLLVIADEYWVDFGARFPELPAVISNGLFPATILAVVTGGCYLLIRKRPGSSNNEAIQSLFVFFVVALVVLTLVGVWFRGEGMSLVWPWNS